MKFLLFLLQFLLLLLLFVPFSILHQENAKEIASSTKIIAAENLRNEKYEKHLLTQEKPFRILVAYAPETKSHLGSLMPLINRLATAAGHHVHIFHISSEETTPKMAVNVSLINVQINEEIVKGSRGKGMNTYIWTRTLVSPILALVYEMVGRNFVDLLENYASETVDVLNSQWDLVIVSELFAMHGYAFAKLLRQHRQIPYIVFCSTMMMGSTEYANALGHSWVTHPHPISPTPRHFTDIYLPNNLSHRIVNFLEYLGDMIGSIYIDNFAIAHRLALLTGKADFSFAKFYANSEMSMVDSIAYLAYPQPDVAELLNAGSHCEEANELPEEYRNFVEDPLSKGTIYVAFGTLIPWDYASPHVVKAFFDAFERLTDYRIIFSFRGKSPQRKLSSHIWLVSWAPQLDLLSHPKTKVFLTHCGLKSIKESLCSKTPMLAMPVFAEQNHNAYLVIKFGTGLALNKFNIDAEQLYNALRELLDNPKYVKRVEKLQRIFLDRPMPALDQAAHFVRKIIKKGTTRRGRHFFNRRGIQLNFLQYFYVDLLIFIVLFSIFIAWK